MLDYHIGMAPIVEDMEHKKTIGFFFLKDVFWLLKFGKFDFLDKSVLHLLQTIYRDNQDWVSMPSDEEEEEDEGEEYAVNDDEAKVFLEEMDSDRDSKNSHDSNYRSKSFALENNEDVKKKLSANPDLNKNMEAYASESNIIKNSNDKLSDGLGENHKNNSSVFKSRDNSDCEINEEMHKAKLVKHNTDQSHLNVHRGKYIESTEKMLHMIHTSSVNSVTHDYTSK